MKKLILALAIASLGASAPTVTDTFVRIQCDPAAGTATAFFELATVIDGKTYAQPWEAVSWPIGSSTTIKYSFGGQGRSITYAEVLTAVQAIAQQERTAQAKP